MADHPNPELVYQIASALDFPGSLRLDEVVEYFPIQGVAAPDRVAVAAALLVMVEYGIIRSSPPRGPDSVAALLAAPTGYSFATSDRGRQWLKTYEANRVLQFSTSATAQELGNLPLPIENCRIWFKFLCPRTWNNLQATDQPDVRYCSTCKKNVHFCDTHQALEEHRQVGNCVCFGQVLNDEDSFLLGMPTEVG